MDKKSTELFEIATNNLDELFSETEFDYLGTLTESTISNIQRISDKDIEQVGEIIGAALSNKTEEDIKILIEAIENSYNQFNDIRRERGELLEDIDPKLKEIKNSVDMEFAGDFL
jgi:hypothetical protein